LNALIVRPVINLLLFFYQWLGQQTVLAVVAVTVVFRLALTPLTFQQRFSQEKTEHKKQALQSRKQVLQEQYKDNPAKLMEEQLKLYQDLNKTSMTGCLILLLQLPIMIGVYRAVTLTLAVTPLRLLDLPGQIYPWLSTLSATIPLDNRFLWLDLALPDPYFVLPLLVAGTSWIRQKLTKSAVDNAAGKRNWYVSIALSMLSVFIVASLASGLAIYLLISGLIGILEYHLIIRPNIAKLADQKSSEPETTEPPPTMQAATEKV
jgi:YidC/Oxa1 family membrane protein insertase